ncbi:hypothetical protein MJD09_14125, partial [bacterium]|nr:hypothetical protein [bacterium]
MGSFEAMMEAGNHLSPHVKPWVIWMQFILFLAPLFFLKWAAARWLVVAQLVNIAVAYAVFVAQGDQVTRLFGLGHFAWIVPLWFLAADVRSDNWIVYRLFAGAAAATILISLVLDTRDIALWLGGDRGEITVKPSATML